MIINPYLKKNIFYLHGKKNKTLFGMKNIYIFLTALFLILSTQSSAVADDTDFSGSISMGKTENWDQRIWDAELKEFKEYVEMGVEPEFVKFVKYDYAGYYGVVDKKGIPTGYGIFEFKNGGTYAGAVKKGKPHGWGLYMDNTSNDKLSSGKFKHGRLYLKVSSTTRIRFTINPQKPIKNTPQVKGSGPVSNKWFEAELAPNGKYYLTVKGKAEMTMAKSKAKGGC